VALITPLLCVVEEVAVASTSNPHNLKAALLPSLRLAEAVAASLVAVASLQQSTTTKPFFLF
jgi:hypothetical protein